MERAELAELHNITLIVNLPSIVRHGIVCNDGAAKLNAVSIAMQTVQAQRATKQVPGGYLIHEYACLYLNCRNPMMFLRLHQQLCVLAIDPAILDAPNVVVPDQNAVSKWARFAAAPNGLAIVNREKTFAENWKHPDDQIEEWRHKSAMCAEVLVPNRIQPSFIRGAHVSCMVARESVEALRLPLDTDRNRLFFR